MKCYVCFTKGHPRWYVERSKDVPFQTVCARCLDELGCAQNEAGASLALWRSLLIREGDASRARHAVGLENNWIA